MFESPQKIETIYIVTSYMTTPSRVIDVVKQSVCKHLLNIDSVDKALLENYFWII